MQKNKVFGLIGRNIDYSFSKEYFSKKFMNEKINCHYSNFDIDDISVLDSIFTKYNISGLNVTIPYKVEIMGILDKIDEEAASIGAVNTIKIIGDKKIGYNTDHIGFERSISSLIVDKKPENALLLGSGGASKAIKYVLKKLNINHSTVSRESGKSDYTYEDIDEALIKKNKIIINCSPVGTFPEIKNCPKIPYEYLSKEHILYDLVYNPIKTLFLKKGDQIGCKTKNGLEMLEIQANESWKIWNI
tara:strand:+ start:6646 stop:7383 length:738 start_codon:yes stop_codon:yes gene_type:complete